MATTERLEHIKGDEILKALEKLKPDPNKVFTITLKEESNAFLNKVTKSTQKGKWAKVAQEMGKENLLGGIGEEVLGLTEKFRENFTFRNSHKIPSKHK